MATAENNASPPAEPPALPPQVQAKPAAPAAAAEPPPPSIRGESQYDRVSSMMMSAVIAMAFLVGFLGLVHLTNSAYATRVTNPLEIVEVIGGEGGGGAPDADPNDSGSAVDVAGATAGDMASNSDTDAPDFEEPSLQQVSATALDMTASNDMSEMDVGAAVSSNNMVASGPRRSRAGTGRVGFGPGGTGDGGVRREQRWSVVYNPGQTPEEYARQLDAFGVEIGVIKNNTMTYISKLSAATPQTRLGQHASDNRLFFVWQSNTRKASDVELLRKAGIEVGDSPIFHFYPKAVEDTLAQMEVRHKGRQPAEIKATRFSVVSKGGSYGFAILAQEPLVR